jgi:hypothetical protein
LAQFVPKTINISLSYNNLGFKAWLPDFSLHNIPKGGKIYQNSTKLPNDHKMFKMAVVYSKCPNVPFQDPPKFTQIVIFWFGNIPSGNPDSKAF